MEYSTSTNTAFLDAMSNLGEGLLFTLGVIAILAFVAIRMIPIYQARLEEKSEIEKTRMENEAEIAKMREDRKAKEEERLAQRDIERSQTEGRWLSQNERWLALQEQTNTVVEGVREQMQINNALLEESKTGSRAMAAQGADTNRLVAEIHHAVVEK